MAIFQNNREYVCRLRWLRVFFLLAIAVVFLKLWYLTVVRFESYADLAERNRVRTVPLAAARGLVVDRGGRVLAENIYGFDLVLYRDEKPDLEQTTRFLEEGLDISAEAIERRLKDASHYNIYQPIVLKENLTMEEITYLLAHQVDHPELEIFKQPRRLYRHGSLAAHLLGYVGEVSPAELERAEFQKSRPGDIVGKYGVEKTYNTLLTGKNGERRVLVNSRGKALEELSSVSPKEGRQLILSIDLDLQQVAEEELSDTPGALIAFDPRDGEVLAMASRPSFNPNLFATRITATNWRELVDNPDHPLQNRVLQSNFSPGSIYKVVIALAGLERGLVTPDTSVYCNGSITLYGHTFRCWNSGGHGWVRLREAIQHSCNVYFYTLGQKLGIDQIANYSRLVGLGRATGIDLSGEALGLVPTPDWKRNLTGRPWYAGETISVAIGQGPVNVTPLQLARAIGVIATGKMPTLHVSRNPFPNGEVEEGTLPAEFLKENLQSIRDGMWRVVNEHGTGRGARVEGFEVCGKTGTVQTIGSATRARLNKQDAAKFAPNAWFVGFAPRDNPEIVVAVLIQRGKSGGSSAAPIAGKLLKRYYDKREEHEPSLRLVRNSPLKTEALTAAGTR